MLSAHFQGTPYDPYTNRNTGMRGMYRSIGINRTGVTSICQIRSGVPEEIKGIEWICYGPTTFSCWVPVYTNVPSLPDYISKVTLDTSTNNLYWTCRLIASMAAFVLAKYDFPGGQTFFKLVTVAMMFSYYVTGIPNFIILNKLGWVDSPLAIIVPSFAAPMGLFLMKQFMEGLPTALIEAAKIDGANEWTVFSTIVMPNVKPAWMTMIIFQVQALWNNKAQTIIYSEEKKPLVFALQQIQAGGIARTGQGAAVLVVVMIVPILIFVFSESQILETMASSGIKE